jgi:hypothetical protein
MKEHQGEAPDTQEKSKSMFEMAEFLKKESKDTAEIIHDIRLFVEKHSESLPVQYQPKSIIESRFMSAEEAFDKGVLSCGSMANIAAAMLRHIGYEVRLVHGEWDGSVDHAWISVLDTDSGTWNEYDLTTNDEGLRPGNMKKAEVDSWDEIRDVITKDHETLRQRRIEKGLTQARE